MRRDGITILLICSICLFGSDYAAAQSESRACATPSWTADVIGDLLWARNTSSPDLIDNHRAGVVFLDKERLLVYEVEVEVSVEPGKFSSRQSPDISSPYKLRASIFDVVSGRKTASLEWSTRLHGASVHATSAGILVQTGEILRLYSKDLVKLEEATLPNPDGDDPVVIITSSATGETILANRINGRSSRLDVLDGGTLKLRQAWTQSPPLRHLYTISDTELAAADFNQEHMLLTDFGTHKWKDVAGKPTLTDVFLPTLVTDTTLVNSCKRLSYMTTGGELIFQDAFGKYESLEEKTAVAQNGTAIAVCLNRRKGSDFWDTGSGLQIIAMHVLVYDLMLKKRVFTFELAPLPRADLDYALSPDGSRLAVLYDRRLTVCSVPVQPAERTGTVDSKSGGLSAP